MAMEFARTAAAHLPRLMTPGCRTAPGVFCYLAQGSRIGETLRFVLIAVFGAAGTLARYGLQGLVQIRIGSTFPYGTLLVNLTGCFFLGMIGQMMLNRMMVSSEWRLAIAVGFFGGYTPRFRASAGKPRKCCRRENGCAR
jgi:hypothetical protein